MKIPLQTLIRFIAVSLALQLGASLFAGGSPSVKPKPSAAEREREAIALYNKGTELLFAGDYLAAEKQLKQALRKKKDLAEAHNNLAFALRKQGPREFKSALKHYNEAVEIDSEIAEARMYRGVLYVAMGEAELAQNDLNWLQSKAPALATELKWVIENGREKEPAQFFGVTEAL